MSAGDRAKCGAHPCRTTIVTTLSDGTLSTRSGPRSRSAMKELHVHRGQAKLFSEPFPRSSSFRNEGRLRSNRVALWYSGMLMHTVALDVEATDLADESYRSPAWRCSEILGRKNQISSARRLWIYRYCCRHPDRSIP